MPVSLQHKVRGVFLTKEYADEGEKLLRELNSFVTPTTSKKIFGGLGLDPLVGLDLHLLKRLPFFKQMQLVDQLTYLNFLLERQDKAGMGHAMEARLPFLDQALVEVIMPLAEESLISPPFLKKPLTGR